MLNIPSQGLGQPQIETTGGAESEMGKQLHQMFSTVSTTNELALCLEQRLHAVLRPSHPTPEKSEPEKLVPMLSPLADAIKSKGKELQSTNEVLSDLLNRLAL